MGMFGKRLLNAIGAGLTGVDFAEMGRTREREAERQKLVGEIGTLLMPGYTPGAAPQVGLGGEGNTDTWQYEAPQRTREPLNANSPDLASIAFKASQMGVPIDKLLDVLKTQQPNVQYDRGFGYNQKTGENMGGFHPDVGEGRVAQMGPDGQPIGISNLPGYAQSVGEIERAKSQATESTKAAYDLVDVPMSDGSSVKVPRELALKLLGGAGQAPGGFGQTQTPADRVAAEGAARTSVDKAAEAPKARAMMNEMDRTTDAVLARIKEAKAKIGPLTAGFGANLSGIAGTSAYDLAAALKSIGGVVSVDRLQTMRGNSPTGGALGSITERELEMLSSLEGSIAQGQSPQQLLQSLNTLEANLTSIKQQRNAAFGQTYSGTPQAGAPGPAATPRTSGKGYRIISVD